MLAAATAFLGPGSWASSGLLTTTASVSIVADDSVGELSDEVLLAIPASVEFGAWGGD